MTAAPRPIHSYARQLASAERGSWSVGRDIRWGALDLRRARAQQDLLAELRDSALAKSAEPVAMAALLRVLGDDVHASVLVVLDLYDSLKHFHALRSYLEVSEYQPALTDDELRAARRGPVHASTSISPVARMVEFMLAQHLDVYLFRRLGELADEPVLAELLALIAADEARHARAAADYLAARLAAEPAVAAEITETAAQLRETRSRALSRKSMPREMTALEAFTRQIERLAKKT